MITSGDADLMKLAIDAAEAVRCFTSPKPWVGCVIVSKSGEIFTGSTFETENDHAEVVALRKAGENARGATAYVTLEPCAHQGSTPPCADAIIAAGLSKIYIGIEDVDEKVSGRGMEKLRNAGIEVEVGLLAEEIKIQLESYLKHRETGNPYVVLKVGMTLDGFIADKSGNSQWITGEEARIDAHKLRAQSDAVIVGAGTVRKDNPTLTVRDYKPREIRDGLLSDPVRVVLGSVSSEAKVNPCQQMSGPLDSILKELGGQGIMQLLVEGGASVAHDFHSAGLVDKYVFYMAPAIFGGGDALGVFGNGSTPLFKDLWRGKFSSVELLGSDIKIECVSEDR